MEKEFFKLINLAYDSQKHVKICLDQENDEGAVTSYIEILKERFKGYSYQGKGKSKEEILQSADDLLQNKISLLGYPSQQMGEKIDWVYYPENDMQWQSHLGYLYFTEDLVWAYQISKKTVYLEKWQDIWRQFLENHPYGTNDLYYSTAYAMQESEYMPVTGGEGFCKGYIGGSWISLACAIRSDNFLNQLAPIIGEEGIDHKLICKLAASMMGDHVNVMIANPRKGTPNQFFRVASALTKLGTMFYEFYTAPATYLIGMDYLEQAMNKSILPDGSDLEQSFNYNSSLPMEFYGLYSFALMKGNERMKQLMKKVEKRLLFLTLIITPLGNYPDIAKTHGSDHISFLLESLSPKYKMPIMQQVLDSIHGKTVLKDLPTTVHFPYGGYSVFRSSWEKNALYMLIKYSRYAPGHKHEDANSIVLTAFKCNLLVDSGHYNYSDDPLSTKINQYCLSAQAHNTVTIDGKNQNRMSMEKNMFVDERNPEITNNQDAYELLQQFLSYHSKECEGIRSSCEDYDYVKCVYEDGYEDLQVIFEREIYFMKQSFFVVCDTVECKDEEYHKFSSHWHLGTDFTMDHVSLNSDGFETTRKDGPNLLVQELNGRTFSHQVFFGEKEPYRGWYVKEYGSMIPAVEIESSFWGSGKQTATYLIYPLDVKGEEKDEK